MANRSDREQGQPTKCPRRHSLISRMGPSSRTPSGPAVQISTASTGRTEDCTRPTPLHHFTLATREPSTEDIRGSPGFDSRLGFGPQAIYFACQAAARVSHDRFQHLYSPLQGIGRSSRSLSGDSLRPSRCGERPRQAAKRHHAEEDDQVAWVNEQANSPRRAR